MEDNMTISQPSVLIITLKDSNNNSEATNPGGLSAYFVHQFFINLFHYSQTFCKQNLSYNSYLEHNDQDDQDDDDVYEYETQKDAKHNIIIID